MSDLHYRYFVHERRGRDEAFVMQASPVPVDPDIDDQETVTVDWDNRYYSVVAVNEEHARYRAEALLARTQVWSATGI